LCMVMQLGNLTFSSHPSNEEGSTITSNEELSLLSDLMGIPPDEMEKRLTNRTVVAGKEEYTVPLKVEDAMDSCDAFAKEVYHQIFDWLVRAINSATSAEFNYAGAKDVEQFGIIGLLDIFGFEAFKVNRFEQLCINYTNEKLQKKYIVDVFRSKEEYEYEGIDMINLTVDDNAEVLNLIEGRIGIMAVLNEECVRPQGNDITFVSKVKTMNKESNCLVINNLHKPSEFAMEHYAGVVKYDATKFVQKNNDSLPMDLLICASKCQNDIIKSELENVAQSVSEAKVKSGRKASSKTIAFKFKTQLSSLMSNIGKTWTRYIRCVKPNKMMIPVTMDMLSSMEQLRSAGVVEAVKISRVAFPTRLLHEAVINRFQFIAQGVYADQCTENECDLRSDVEKLLSLQLKAKEKKVGDTIIKAFFCGRTLTYFKMGALEFLEATRLLALGKKAAIIQRIFVGSCTSFYTSRHCQSQIFERKNCSIIIILLVSMLQGASITIDTSD
ncbi:MAG: myosin family protein, partial [Gloeomargaritales cyanobacterium]